MANPLSRCQAEISYLYSRSRYGERYGCVRRCEVCYPRSNNACTVMLVMTGASAPSTCCARASGQSNPTRFLRATPPSESRFILCIIVRDLIHGLPEGHHPSSPPHLGEGFLTQ